MKNQPLVSIIIVNWNGIDVLENCLESLSRISYKNVELIFVDNGSIDGSEKVVEKYKKHFKGLQKIINKQNVGFAPANNQGYEKAKGEYILLLNNDTTVSMNFLTGLVKRAEKDTDVGVVQPKIYIMDQKNTLDNVGSFLTWTGFLVHYGFLEKDSRRFGREMPIFSAKGACMLIKREVIEKVGLFDDSFKSYFEETDFCWRVWLSGYKIIYYPKVHIYHKLGFTSKKILQVEVNYFPSKNRMFSLFKNLSTKNLLTIFSAHLFFNFALSGYYLIKFQFKNSLMFLRVIFSFLINLPRLILARQKTQGMREVSDTELFRTIKKPLNIINMYQHFQRIENNFKS